MVSTRPDDSGLTWDSSSRIFPCVTTTTSASGMFQAQSHSSRSLQTAISSFRTQPDMAAASQYMYLPSADSARITTGSLIFRESSCSWSKSRSPSESVTIRSVGPMRMSVIFVHIPYKAARPAGVPTPAFADSPAGASPPASAESPAGVPTPAFADSRKVSSTKTFRRISAASFSVNGSPEATKLSPPKNCER